MSVLFLTRLLNWVTAPKVPIWLFGMNRLAPSLICKVPEQAVLSQPVCFFTTTAACLTPLPAVQAQGEQELFQSSHTAVSASQWQILTPFRTSFHHEPILILSGARVRLLERELLQSSYTAVSASQWHGLTSFITIFHHQLILNMSSGATVFLAMRTCTACQDETTSGQPRQWVALLCRGKEECEGVCLKPTFLLAALALCPSSCAICVAMTDAVIGRAEKMNGTGSKPSKPGGPKSGS